MGPDMFLVNLLLQVPSAADYESGWQWVAASVFAVALIVVGFLYRENSKLRDTMLKNAVEASENWQTNAETCTTDAAKTADALKLSNDTTIALAGKVDVIAGTQVQFSDRLDRNGDQLRDILSRLERCQGVMDRIADRFSTRGGT